VGAAGGPVATNSVAANSIRWRILKVERGAILDGAGRCCSELDPMEDTERLYQFCYLVRFQVVAANSIRWRILKAEVIQGMATAQQLVAANSIRWRILKARVGDTTIASVPVVAANSIRWSIL